MTDSKNQSQNKRTSGSSDAPPAADGRQENRRNRGEKRGGRRDREVKKETLNGKNELSKLEGFLKQSKVERK